MKPLKNTLQEIDTLVLKESADKIQQVQRNQVKQMLMNGLFESLKSNGIQVDKVADGLTVTVDNQEIGAFFVTLDMKVRNLDYDLETEINDYNDKVAEKLETDKKKAETKAKAIAKTRQAKKEATE